MLDFFQNIAFLCCNFNIEMWLYTNENGLKRKQSIIHFKKILKINAERPQYMFYFKF